MPNPQDVSRCLRLSDTQQYVVSDFHNSELYEGGYTYLYHAAVKDWHNPDSNVGGIALVFDSQPEFKAMLVDSEPNYANAILNDVTSSVLIDRSGLVISSTSDEIEIGSTLNTPKEILDAEKGTNDTIFWQWDEKPCLVGYRVPGIQKRRWL
jgi:hypothetical protein